MLNTKTEPRFYMSVCDIAHSLLFLLIKKKENIKLIFRE